MVLLDVNFSVESLGKWSKKAIKSEPERSVENPMLKLTRLNGDQIIDDIQIKPDVHMWKLLENPTEIFKAYTGRLAMNRNDQAELKLWLAPDCRVQ